MDIDTPTAYAFGSSYPLPFRVLALSFLTVLAFGTNLHTLAWLGIDTAEVLDVRVHAQRLPSRGAASPYVHPSKLYPPLYGLAAVGFAWTAAGWLVLGLITGGEVEHMVQWRAVPGGFMLVVVLGVLGPWDVLYRKERYMFLRALKRTVLGPLYSPVPFSDVILADILTSSAKVLGDVWVSGCLLLTASERFGLGGELGGGGGARVWMVPLMTSLPYIFRLRQCISEYVTGSTPTPRRSLLNALKYASAFPVIIFSAMQTVVGDPFDETVEGVVVLETGWIGKDTLWGLWILAVLINSLYSFWWDVTNDWGLSLLTPNGWSAVPSISYAFNHPPSSHTRSPTLHAPGRSRATLSISTADLGNAPLPHSPSTRPLKSFKPPSTPRSRSRVGGHSRAFSTASTPNVSHPFLRPVLLFPDPLVYYFAIAIDLVLRLTWSLKLSSHLHSISEIESGVFMMESLEVLRRWMWTYLRLEWEAVKNGGGEVDIKDTRDEKRVLVEEDMEMEQRRAEGSGTWNGNGEVSGSVEKEEVGLGIIAERDGM